MHCLVADCLLPAPKRPTISVIATRISRIDKERFSVSLFPRSVRQYYSHRRYRIHAGFGQRIVRRRLSGVFPAISLQHRKFHGFDVAVKELFDTVHNYKKYLDREITNQKSLDHPNCLKLYGISRAEDSDGSQKTYLVMELGGKTLTQLLFGKQRVKSFRYPSER